MSSKKVIVKRIVSPDGKIIAQAYSEVTISDESNSTSYQSVTVTISSGNSYSSSSSSSVSSH